MNSEQLRQFLVVAECGNMTKAAGLLYVAQSSLSYTIKKIEDELNCRLFDRLGNRIVLNDNGKRLLKYSMRSAVLFSELQHEFSRSVDDSNAVRIKSYSSVQPLIMEYSRLDPTTPLHISNIHDFDEISELFSNNDVIIADSSYARYLNQKGLRIRFLFTDELLLSILPTDPMASQRQVTLEEISQRELAVVRSIYNSGNLYNWITDIATSVNVEFHFVREVSQAYWKSLYNSEYPFFARSMVCLYDDAVIAPRVYLPINSPLARKDIYLYYYQDKEQKLFKFFETMERVRDLFQQHRTNLPG